MKNKVNKYLEGISLIGDDYSLKQIEKWFKSEEEGYANLGAKDKKNYKYKYHALNNQVCFKYLEEKRYENVLGIGSAYGDEFLPIINLIENITILDPSDCFSLNNNILKVPCKYIKPNINGDLPFKDDSFDLIVSFGVLHHIPNVSHVMSECFRVLKFNGKMLLREPIVSMGDWSFPRKGLTKNERGIPYKIFNKIIINTGFSEKKSTLCDFSIIPKICKLLGINPYSNLFITKADILFSKLFKWNINYHPKSIINKIRPASVAFVLSKDKNKFKNER